ncbi:MAG: ABC transporter permease [Solirubrobacteraceae bacterium]|nr:ABC transporter permease [Solirubrobacteraceae bacterium]
MIRAVLAKDLRVLRRSPALLALVILYPLLIAVGLGIALTREPEPPTVAVVNLLPKDGAGTVTISGQKLSLADLQGSLAGRDVKTVDVASREKAVAMLKAGTIDGALVIPADAATTLANELTSGGVSAGPELEVLYRSSGPLDGTLVRALVAARLRSAERVLAGEIVRVATGFLGILRDGGKIEILGQSIDVLGLKSAEAVVTAGASQLPESKRSGLDAAAEFARLARQNLDLSDDILRTVAKPLNVKETAIGEQSGSKTLKGFAVGVAAALSVMLVAMTLGAGLLASEREEGTMRRLLRGGHGAWRLTVAKLLGGGIVAAGSGLLLLLGIAIAGAASWAGAPLWIPALLLAGAAFAAFGVLLGAGLRDARAATLAAILLAVPIAVIALIPDQAVSGALGSALDALSAVLPFQPARELLDGAVAAQVNAGAGGQLLAQCAFYAVAAGVLVRRARA